MNYLNIPYPLTIPHGLPRWLSGKKKKKKICANAEATGDTCSFLCQEDPLEKEMPTHSSILAWRIPGTEGPGKLQSMGSQRVRHD